jgi:16S rRNA (cytidine1402-2'-O)-methyltransferase
LRLLKEGKDIALISDAGTPGINDPGFVLIRQAIENNLEISAIPGPCALTNALVLSGLASDRFIFEGYLPVKKISRQKKLAALAKEERTLIFYESPHRFLKALENIAQVFPERKIAVCREMTKKFEEVKRGTAGELLEYYKTKRILGELVILIAGEK